MDDVTDSRARPGAVAQARGPGRQPGREQHRRRSGSSSRRSRSPATHPPGRRCSPGWGSSITAPVAGRSTERCLREALTLLPPDEESVLVARIHAGLALFGAAWSRLDLAEQSCRRGLEIARRVGARREEGLLVNASGSSSRPTATSSPARGCCGRPSPSRPRSAIPDDLATAYVNLSHVLGLGGRVDEIVEVVREGADVLTRMGLARQRVSFLKANLAETLGNAGRIAESGRVIAEAVSQHPRGIMAGAGAVAGRPRRDDTGRPRRGVGVAGAGPGHRRVGERPGVLPPIPRRDRGGGRAVGRAARSPHTTS